MGRTIPTGYGPMSSKSAWGFYKALTDDQWRAIEQYLNARIPGLPGRVPDARQVFDCLLLILWEDLPIKGNHGGLNGNSLLRNLRRWVENREHYDFSKAWQVYLQKLSTPRFKQWVQVFDYYRESCDRPLQVEIRLLSKRHRDWFRIMADELRKEKIRRTRSV